MYDGTAPRRKSAGLKWSDIDFENRRLRVERSLSAVTNGKNSDRRNQKRARANGQLSCRRRLLCFLPKRKENVLNEWVFYNPCNPNLPMNPAAAYQKLHTILKKMRSCREFAFMTYATPLPPMRRKAESIRKTLSGILGHTNASFHARHLYTRDG